MIEKLKQLDPEKVFAWAVGFGLAVVVVLFLMVAQSCHHPRPVTIPTVPPAVPAATASAQVQSTAIASQSVRIILHRRRDVVGTSSSGSTSQEPLYGDLGSRKVLQDPGNLDDLEIDVTQEAIATSSATSSAAAIAPSTPSAPPAIAPGDHARLGVLAGLQPGVLSVDFEALSVKTPAAVLGQPLEVGLDVEANHLQAGAGVSLGGKMFVEGGAWSSWNVSKQGWYAAVGLRF